MTITEANRLADEYQSRLGPDGVKALREMTSRIHKITTDYFNACAEQHGWIAGNLESDAIDELHNALSEITSSQRTFLSLCVGLEKRLGNTIFSPLQTFSRQLAIMNTRLLQWAIAFEIDHDLADFDSEIRGAFARAGAGSPSMPAEYNGNPFDVIRHGQELVSWFDKTIEDELTAIRRARANLRSPQFKADDHNGNAAVTEHAGLAAKHRGDTRPAALQTKLTDEAIHLLRYLANQPRREWIASGAAYSHAGLTGKRCRAAAIELKGCHFVEIQGSQNRIQQIAASEAGRNWVNGEQEDCQ